MILNLCLISLLFFSGIIFAKNNSLDQKDRVMCVTIPKTGTHLLLKCITLIDAPDISYKYWELPKGRHIINLKDPIQKSFTDAVEKNDHKAFSRHLIYTQEARDFLNKNMFANFFMIRDPRSQLVSQAFDFAKHRIGGNKRPIEEIMLDMILARKENFLPLKRHLKNKHLPKHKIVAIADLFWHIGMNKFYELFIPWIKSENFYTVRFEDLIGEQGGGTKEAQIQEIRNIAKHLGVELVDTKINHIASELFGGTGTFREGKKDSWKEYFTPHVKKAFQSDAGLMQLLIDWGYEKDKNW